MKVITVANHKGGVGKTALSAHIAWFMAEQGARVLAVDLDAQGNFTDTFTTRDDVVRAGGAEALFAEAGAMPEPIQVAERLMLMRASNDLDTVDARAEVETVFAFRERLTDLARDDYDVVVIDTPPTLKARTTAALASSQYVITPFVPEVYSITGLEDLFRHIQRVRRNLNHGLSEAIGVANLVNPQAALHQELVRQVSARMRVLRPLLHRRIAVAEALASEAPVWTMRGAKIAGDEWRALCAAVNEAIT